MLEADLQTAVVDLARRLGGLVYHTHDSRHSAKGFPDLVIVFEQTGAILFVELKRDGKDPTPEQRQWLRALAHRGIVFVWRPADLRDQSIARALVRYARGTS